MRSVVHRKKPEPERKIVFLSGSSSDSSSDEDTVNQVVGEVSEELKEEIKRLKRKRRKFRKTEKELWKTIKYYQKSLSEANHENEYLVTINSSLKSEISCKGQDCSMNKFSFSCFQLLFRCLDRRTGDSCNRVRSTDRTWR